MLEKVLLTGADSSSHIVRNAIRKNGIIARDAMRLIANRHRKLDPQESFEQIANTVGIVTAEFITASHAVFGIDMAIAMRELINNHMNAAIERLENEADQ